MSDERFESVTESASHMSKDVPGARAISVSLEQNVCDECGLVRLFIVLEDEAGNRTVASFDENGAAYWGMLLLNAAKDIYELNQGLGQGFNLN